MGSWDNVAKEVSLEEEPKKISSWDDVAKDIEKPVGKKSTWKTIADSIVKVTPYLNPVTGSTMIGNKIGKKVTDLLLNEGSEETKKDKENWNYINSAPDSKERDRRIKESREPGTIDPWIDPVSIGAMGIVGFGKGIIQGGIKKGIQTGVSEAVSEATFGAKDIIQNISKRSRVTTEKGKKIVTEAIDFAKDFDNALNSPPVEPIKINIFDKTPSLNTKAPIKPSVDKPMEDIFSSSDASRIIKKPNSIFNQVAEDAPVQAETIKSLNDKKYTKSLNMEKYDITDIQERNIRRASEIIDEMAPVTNDEIIKSAEGAKVLTEIIPRKKQVELAGQLLETRRVIAGEDWKNITPAKMNTMKALSSTIHSIRTQFSSLKISASPTVKSTRDDIANHLEKLGVSLDEIVNAGKGVDWNNANEVTKFYRSFVAPTKKEIINEMRYINMLSSPLTHGKNLATNLIQATVTRPLTRTFGGIIDPIASKITGKEREFYLKQVPAYYQGVFGSTKQAFKEARKAIKGEVGIYRPDLSNMPTNSKLTKWGYPVMRFLEAGDRYFRALIEGGEMAAYAKIGKNEAEASLKSKKTASTLLFRDALDPNNKEGQGKLLSWIDKATGAAYNLRNNFPKLRWIVPFIETPMNILKQGIEYSPLGFATLKGNTAKVEQLSKAFLGSTVAGIGAWQAFNGNVTWAGPKDPVLRKAWEAEGKKPYSIRIGDKWISLGFLGPLAYPFAMAAATKWFFEENPKAAVDNNTMKGIKTIAGIGEYFSDQSYMDGVGDLADIMDNEDAAAGQALIAAINPTKQMIPLSGLLGWTSRMIDDTYRSPSKSFSMSTVRDNFMKDLPGLSMMVDPKLNIAGEEAKRPYPIVNAFSPVQISPNDKEAGVEYKEILQAKKEQAIKTDKLKEYQEDWGELDKEDQLALIDFMETLNPQERKKARKEYRKVMRTKDVESGYWFKIMAGVPPEIAAKIIYRKMENLSPMEQAELMNNARKYKMLTSPFRRAYMKQQQIEFGLDEEEL
jgi:hypothetical protein